MTDFELLLFQKELDLIFTSARIEYKIRVLLGKQQTITGAKNK